LILLPPREIVELNPFKFHIYIYTHHEVRRSPFHRGSSPDSPISSWQSYFTSDVFRNHPWACKISDHSWNLELLLTFQQDSNFHPH
jgi:hypothetical protein